MYCPECGTRLEDDALFCPECGTKVMHEEEAVPVQQPQRPQQPTNVAPAAPANEPARTENTNRQPQQQQRPQQQPQEQPDTRPVFARGLILTNIASLSNRLKIDEVALKGIINNYIEDLKNLGLSYRLIDASDYTYMHANLFGKHKHVSLTGRDPWYEYADLTLDQHEWEKKQGMPESEYLFIIGGSRDVPMPRVPNFLADEFDGKEDKTMDTDLLYAYPYGEKMEKDLLSQRLFRYDALFYVGRLPIADNGTIADLTGYLDRNVRLKCAVPEGYAYCQCDPNWKKVTNVITSSLAKRGYFQAIDGLPESALFDRHILLTPVVGLEDDIHPLFNPNAAYIFFNMHGGPDMGSYYFYGTPLGQRYPFDEGFSPRLISLSECPNILFTQACFGGRFVGFPKEYSMVLTALSNMTMAYVGSSRTAIGGVDRGGQLGQSDILAKSFTEHMLTGMSVGSAFFAARMDTFKHRPGALDYALTIAEFNLFGDPMIHFDVPDSKFITADVSKSAPLGENEVLNVPQSEVLMNKSAGAAPQSMLDQLRSAVDANIMKIHEVIAKQLYEQYNIPAREPLIVKRNTYPDGHRELKYNYPLEAVSEEARSYAFVVANENGEIQDVTLTK